MTEHQWQHSINPEDMLRAMHPRASVRRGATLPRKFSPRKKRLLMCACCRRLWHLLPDERSRQAVVVAESLVEGLADQADLAAAQEAAAQAQYHFHTLPPTVPKTLALQRRAANVAVQAAWSSRRLAVHFVPAETAAILGDLAGQPEDCEPTTAWRRAMKQANREFAGLVREVFGNPFRPIAFDAAHRTMTVASLARAAYDERHLPSGELDLQRLAVLSDALEEAGAKGEILDRLRSPGPHVRGCWSVDLCLGLS